MSKNENTNTAGTVSNEDGFDNSQGADATNENTIADATEEQTNENSGNNLDSADADGAPEAYDFAELELPEGFQVDAELAERFAPLGKKLNLSQQSANELANLLVESLQKQGTTVTEQLATLKTQEREATKLSYEQMLNTDEEIGGGNKEKMDAYLDIADTGYSAFATDGLKSTLQNLGLDYHPDVVKHFHRLGKLCGSDTIRKPTAPAGSKADPADVLYGKSE